MEISANIGLVCDLLGNLACEDSNDPPQGLGSRVLNQMVKSLMELFLGVAH